MTPLPMAQSWRRLVCAVMTGALRKNDGAKGCAVIIFPTARPWRTAHHHRVKGKSWCGPGAAQLSEVTDMTDDYEDNLAEVAKAIDRCATHLKYLGVGDAATTMGAIEFLGVSIKEGPERLAGAIDGHTEAIKKGLANIAAEIEEKG